MWQRSDDDDRTIWMDITAGERDFTVSLFRQGRGVIAKDTQVLDEETHRNLRDALDELTNQECAAQPEAFSNFGSLLFALALPAKIQIPLRKHEGPLVFSTHQLSLPWELLCVDDRFLCLKHSVSRQLPLLDAMEDALLGGQPAISSDDGSEDAALIISNPTGDLAGAAEEAEELRDIFRNAGLRCDALIGPKECTFANILGARLGKHAYRIIHISGHAQYLEQKETSVIHLAGGRMIMAQDIQRTFKGEPLVFLNACWSAMNEGGQRRGAQPGYSGSRVVRTLTEAFTFGNRSGRARAIVGSMWWIADDVARGLAGCFYQEVLAGHPLGESLRRARQRVSESVTDPALWSTYVLFGDPSQCVAKLPAPISAPSTKPQDKIEVPYQGDIACIPLEKPSDPVVESVSPIDSPVEPLLIRSVPESDDHVDSSPQAESTPAAEVDLPWSDEMRAAFVGAMSAMSMMHWKVFSTVHLILGLTYVENGLVALAMSRSGANPQTTRRSLREAFTVKESDAARDASIISDNLTEVLKTSREAARKEGAAEVTEAHIVRAMLDLKESGGTMLLGCLKVDLEDLRRRVAPKIIDPEQKQESNHQNGKELVEERGHSVRIPYLHGDLMLPSGDLDLALFDDDARRALNEAALIAYRTYWPDLRSPHLFLGMLGRRNSRLAQQLLALKLIDPDALSSSFQAALTKSVNASLRQPKLHREFLSENALLTLRTASGLTAQADRQTISERDILAAILRNDANFITTNLWNFGIDPASLLWSEI
ncbi:MAG: CHAT domain-containing protein [Planctomycetota bacterium]